MTLNIKLFLFSVGSAFISNLIITPILIYLAKKNKWYDRSDERKIHIVPTPRIGGVGIYISFIIGLSVFYAFTKMNTITSSSLTIFQFISIIISISMFFAIGIIDDYHELSARLKFAIQAVTVILLMVAGFRFKEVYIPIIGVDLKLGFFSWILTFCWLIGISNSINLIDGMDGLAGGVSLIGLLGIGIYSLIISDVNISILAFVLAGSTLGFLVFNFPPAKIFMGDAGSYVLGLTLAFITLVNNEAAGSKTLMLAITVTLIPICDTLAAIIRRTANKVHFFTPDREHMHHKLLNLGLTTNQILVVIYFIAICLSGTTIVWALYKNTLSIILMLSCWVLTITFFFVLFLHHKKYFKNDEKAQELDRLKREQQKKQLERGI